MLFLFHWSIFRMHLLFLLTSLFHCKKPIGVFSYGTIWVLRHDSYVELHKYIEAIVLELPNVFFVSYWIAKCLREITKEKCNVWLSDNYWIDLRSEWNVCTTHMKKFTFSCYTFSHVVIQPLKMQSCKCLKYYVARRTIIRWLLKAPPVNPRA